MRNPQRSVAAMMAVVGVSALSFAALRNATAVWASALFTVDLVLVGLALVLAIVGRGRMRAFGAGAAVMGGGYLVLAFGPLAERGGVRAPPLITKVLLDTLTPWIFATKDRTVVDGGGEGEDLAPPAVSFQSGPAIIISGTDAAGRRVQVFPGQFATPGRTVLPIVDTHQFRRVGHTLVALLCGIAGGLFGLLVGGRPRQTATQI